MAYFDREIFKEAGRVAALKLRKDAINLTGTEIIEQEKNIPAFVPEKDYFNWPIGSPVTDEGQVWLLLQPHNSSYYTGRPSNLRALWGLAHTKNPNQARPWVDAYGTSGMYMIDECYVDEEGIIWRCLQDNTIYPAKLVPSAWEKVEFN